MRFPRYIRRALALVVALWMISDPGWMAAVVTVGPWTPLFQGVEHAVGTADTNEWRAQVVNALRIDLRASGVRLRSTPDNGAAPLETTSQTAGQFLVEHGLQAAVNTSFYTPCCASIPEGKDLVGLAISGGVLVSPAQPEARAALLVTPFNTARFVNTEAGILDTTGIWTAIAGSNFVLGNRDDLPTSADNIFPARTLAGLGDDVPGDNRYLILLTIDAGMAGASEGASRAESASWLQRFGAHTGINLDGGGSTTMVIGDGSGGATLLNRPNGGIVQRYNGNHLGVVALPFNGPQMSTFTTKWLVGTRNNSVSDFAPESGNANDPPGDPDGLDDDYYFAGSYDAPVGTLLTDESPQFLERAVIRFNPPNDTTLRFHFHLTPAEAHRLNSFRYVTHVYQQEGDGALRCSLVIRFNGVEVDSTNLTEGDDYRSPEFIAAAVDAVAGENILTVQQTGGTAQWTNFDFHQLELKEQPPLLRIQRLSSSSVVLAWTTNVTGFTLESTGDPGSPGGWSTVTNPAFVSGGEHIVIVPSDDPAAFFRLRKTL